MTLPEIIRRHPGTRRVFDRYGLAGCGGPEGPPEPLWFFARAHRVPEPALLQELEQAASEEAAEPSPLDYRPGPADTIYRGFFKAGILTMFTFGCVLGGINLALLAARHQLAALDLRAVTWAHAHAQVAGWVTFFVMGFAYQAFPRFKFTALWKPRLAVLTLYAMAAALAVRTLAGLGPSTSLWFAAGSAAGAAELAIVFTFATILIRTLRSSRQPAEPYDKFVYAALGWMILGFGFDLWVFVASSSLRGYQDWVRFIGLYDAPWRDIQLAGFAAGMILGVSQRFLPFIYGFREVSGRASWWIFGLWNTSVLGGVIGYLQLARTRRPCWAAVLELSAVGMLAAVAVQVRSLGLFSERAESDRSLKFLRAAYAWGLAALILLLLQPLYHSALGIRFSHAYFGAYRHAFTVGFISFMIAGVSSKVVPVLAGVDRNDLGALRVPFWLVNAGNAMRVVFQILTDRFPWAFAPMAASAWVEVAGLAGWAVDLWRTMSRTPDERAAPARVEVSPTTRVLDVIQCYPETISVFLAYGFSLINNPVARRLFARSVTLEQACRLRHVRYETFAAALQAAIQAKT